MLTVTVILAVITVMVSGVDSFIVELAVRRGYYMHLQQGCSRKRCWFIALIHEITMILGLFLLLHWQCKSTESCEPDSFSGHMSKVQIRDLYSAI